MNDSILYYYELTTEDEISIEFILNVFYRAKRFSPISIHL